MARPARPSGFDRVGIPCRRPLAARDGGTLWKARNGLCRSSDPVRPLASTTPLPPGHCLSLTSGSPVDRTVRAETHPLRSLSSAAKSLDPLPPGPPAPPSSARHERILAGGPDLWETVEAHARRSPRTLLSNRP